MTRRILHLLVAVMVMVAPGRLAPAQTLRVVSGTFFGFGDESDIQGVAAGRDGTIYIVGNSSTLARDLPGGISAKTYGVSLENSRCGCGFISHLSADGRRLLHYAQLGKGIALLTTVTVHDGMVYVGGYASSGLEDLLTHRPGLIRQFPLTQEITEFERQKAAGKEDKIAGRPGLGRYGAPCVLRFAEDLQTLSAGTYLEGWQQVWDKKRVSKQGNQMMGGYQEYYWQPTALGVLKNGEIVVCHDGGYFRPLTAKDKALAVNDEKLLDRLSFYDTCDHVSRLSADLVTRRWRKDIYTPTVNADVAKAVKGGWPLDHYSSPRTQRMRLNGDDQIFLCGWSASATSKEPYWSPYLFGFNPDTGEVIARMYEHDPMSGGGNRMGGQVADTAVASFCFDEDGNIVSSLLADGGNTVMEWSPKAQHLGERFEAKIKGGGFGVKLVHWWGQIHRVNAKTHEGIGGARIGPWGWAHDVASLPGNGVLALGRYNWKFQFTDDAWASQSDVENPNAFLRVYAANFNLRFSTALPGVVPFAAERLSANRYAIVGRSESGSSLIRHALFEKPTGKTSGYVMIVDYTDAASAKEKP